MCRNLTGARPGLDSVLVMVKELGGAAQVKRRLEQCGVARRQRESLSNDQLQADAVGPIAAGGDRLEFRKGTSSNPGSDAIPAPVAFEEPTCPLKALRALLAASRRLLGQPAVAVGTAARERSVAEP